ncbi:lipoprotein-anchoring transpeptidase ErfK/SrfK [Amycolatopsis sulphurea]|uniref:Lipoprotein-anchoring transpeptidase ErfK/SrfK n=1 Tax=Amycolatopsis sulphurea TaxID=76022 RepID=A0A2A9F735_9PSEU|nr:Ig-like domain-containing protein [Amycolatopsis sulphurea]PFG46581.1 lipoprotein-anchoring transpeptidase ErfK/SrfK [Amycolatopsis sulphurea]
MFPKKNILSAAGILVATLLASACSSGDDSGSPGTSGSGGSASPATVSIEPADANGMNPTTPIVVKAANGKLTGVTVTSAKGKPVEGKIAPDGLSWTTSEVLGYGGSYHVVAHAQGADGKPVEKAGDVTTITPKKEANANLIPAPSAAKSAGVGVGQPIVFSFATPVKNKAAVEKALSVESSPKQEGGWYWIDDKNVHYRSKEYWQPGTTLTVSAKIYGVDFGNGVFGAEDRTETYKVHDSWIGKADGNSEQMQIFHNGQMVKSMPISMGKDATPTHLGPHVISDKQANYTMDSCTYGVCPPDPKAYRSNEKFSERISNDGEFVHENPNSVGQQGSSNVSHGCINLNAANAQWFFDNFGLGDVVEVTNSGGPQLPLWDLYGDWSKSWPDWQKGSAL